MQKCMSSFITSFGNSFVWQNADGASCSLFHHSNLTFDLSHVLPCCHGIENNIQKLISQHLKLYVHECGLHYKPRLSVNADDSFKGIKYSFCSSWL